jgi:hypothetical protein
MIVSRIIHPGSKLATFNGLTGETSQSSLAEELRLGAIDVKELYESLDWLLERQSRIENKLAKKHLVGGTLVLYDVSSSYYTGRKSDLVKYGYSRDQKKGFHRRLWLTKSQGCPSFEVLAATPRTRTLP